MEVHINLLNSVLLHCQTNLYAFPYSVIPVKPGIHSGRYRLSQNVLKFA